MGDRLDILRSFVRVAADRVKSAAPGRDILERATRAMSMIRNREVVVPAHELQRQLARSMSFRSLSLQLVQGTLGFDIESDSGQPIVFSWSQPRVRFAAQGAKEISVLVESDSPAGVRAASEIFEGFAEMIASRLWPSAHRDSQSDVGTIVERDQSSGLRVDLRSVPAVRRLSRDPTRRLLMEAIGLRAIRFEERGVVFQIHVTGLDAPPK